MRRIFGLAAVAAFAALVTGSAAGSTGVPRYSVSGIETGVPQNETSPFAGTASSLSAGPAVWSASVMHTDLSGCTTTSESCDITGGTFKLSGLLGTITGTFTGGSITPEQNIVGCTNVRYDVSGQVTTNRGGAFFDVVLTHYQTLLFGQCVTYFATVSGSFGP
jgi:hypothetical protein